MQNLVVGFEFVGEKSPGGVEIVVDKTGCSTAALEVAAASAGVVGGGTY